MNAQGLIAFKAIEIGESIDTVHYSLIKKSQTDSSFILSYAVKNNSYEKINEYVLPIYASNTKHFELLQSRDVYYWNKVINVNKYIFDDPNVSDDEKLIFFTKRHGVILEVSLSWNYYWRIIESDRSGFLTEVFLITDQIISDPVFFQRGN